MKAAIEYLTILIALVALTCVLPFAYAHSMYQSAVLLDMHSGSVEARIELPPSRLEKAFGQPINSGNLSAVALRLQLYILQRVSASTAGNAWKVGLVEPVRWETVDGSSYVVANVLLTPPTGVDARSFTLTDDLITDSIPNHVVLVSIRSDWNRSTFANDPELLGVLNGEQRSIEVDRGTGRWTKGFASVFHLGTRHIAEGTDHLLFLLALLLPAPLLRQGRSWGTHASVGLGFKQILKVVTAFTLGHSVTLALAAFGMVHVPANPIEVLIAVSILISAIHALRPLFPGKEAVIAGSFGLIHGLAFASTLAELGLHRWERLAGILAFNLGIETMQLVVVVCVMPSLMLLSRTPFYPAFRITGASLAAVAAGGWIVERSGHVDLRIDRAVDALAQHSILVAATLFIFAGSSLLYTALLH